MSARRARLPGGRWHFQHGPIDLVIGLDGERAACDAAIERGWLRFGALLGELVAELALLRRCAEPHERPRGEVARAMHAAVLPFRPRFVTPMAAVAGAVADAVCGCLAASGVERAYVNDGGDIATFLAPDARPYTIGVAIDRGGAGGPAREAVLPAALVLDAAGRWRGVATRGWRGRSLSLGIADSVTVLALDGARADAAATMVANAVDVVHPGVRRAPAASLRDDSDLGDLPATVDVAPLPRSAIESALDAGEAEARRCIGRGLIGAALIGLQGHWRTVGEPLRHGRPIPAERSAPPPGAGRSPPSCAVRATIPAAGPVAAHRRGLAA
jgi:ApbE superfamily uncharacterized protein (UPF0280 family)